MPEARLACAHGALRAAVSLAPYTSWRVGGPAKHFFEPASREGLIAFVRELPAEEPILWLGLGSNILVRDGGFNGTVIHLHGGLDAIRCETLDGRRETTTADASHPTSHVAHLTAEAGAHCARVAKVAQKEGLAGLGFMAGIPGTVGGALTMNAGAWGGETWSVVAEAEVLYRDGRTAWLPATAFPHGYRHVELPANFCGFLAARFALTLDADGSHAAYTKDALAQRKAAQPVGKPSAGSTFRNPPGNYAARLIESCGLKGFAIGGAHVSPQHANFLITQDGATAADVEALIQHIQATVQAQAGIALHAEVRLVGEPA